MRTIRSGTVLGTCILVIAATAGCGDNLGGSTDAPVTPTADARVDGAGPDAEVPDAGPDAAPTPSFRATISIQEVTVQGIPQLGQGLQVSASFIDELTAVPPVYDEDPSSLFGCKVWEYTLAQAADPGLNEGSFQITATDGNPAMPPCSYVPTRGYLCIGGAGAGGDISLVDATMGLWALTDAEITSAASQVGRYLTVSGAATAANNGSFPIVSSAGANTVIYVNPNPSALPETLPAAATFTLIAGAGPIPGATDPGFLGDADELTVALTSGGDGHFESFTKTFATAGGGVGDDFTLDAGSQTTITSIPTDGTAFTIGCGTCNTATGALLSITTTDAPVAGLAPYSMPLPVTKRVYVRCAQLGASSITVPAAASAFLMGSGATRIQTAFVRSNLQIGSNTSPPVANYTIIAGHNTVGYTTP